MPLEWPPPFASISRQGAIRMMKISPAPRKASPVPPKRRLMYHQFQDLGLGATGVRLRSPVLFAVQNGESEDSGGTRLLPVALHVLFVTKH